MLQDGTITTSVAVAALVDGSAKQTTTQMVVNTAFSQDEKKVLHAAEQLLGDRICENINAGLTSPKISGSPLTYSSDAKQLFLRAWTLAVQLQNKEVAVDHQIAALVASDEATESALGQSAKQDTPYFLAGALVRVSALDAFAGAQTYASLLPSESLLKWIREAGRLAAKRSPREVALSPEDMIAVVRSSEVDKAVRRSVRGALLQASRVGRTQTELVKARRKLENLGMTVSFFRTDADKKFSQLSEKVNALKAGLNAINGSLTTTSNSLQRLPDVAAIEAQLVEIARLASKNHGVQASEFAQLDRRMSENASDIVQKLGEIYRDRPAVPASGEPDLSPFNVMFSDLRKTGKDQSDKLTQLERLTSEMAHQIARPPSARWLILAIMGVLTLGAGAGLALNHATQFSSVAKTSAL